MDKICHLFTKVGSKSHKSKNFWTYKSPKHFFASNHVNPVSCIKITAVSPFFDHRHGGVDPSAVTYIGNQLDCVLQRNADNSDLTVSSTGEEDAQRIIQVLDSLCKQIRGLDLPLNISSLQGISPVFRGAEVWQHLRNPALCTMTNSA